MRGSSDSSNKLIFTEDLPIIGKVPLCNYLKLNTLEFYVPDCEEKESLRALIEKHGGKIANFHECFSFQIYPLNVSFYFPQVFRTNPNGMSTLKERSTQPRGLLSP